MHAQNNWLCANNHQIDRQSMQTFPARKVLVSKGKIDLTISWREFEKKKFKQLRGLFKSELCNWDFNYTADRFLLLLDEILQDGRYFKYTNGASCMTFLQDTTVRRDNFQKIYKLDRLYSSRCKCTTNFVKQFMAQKKKKKKERKRVLLGAVFIQLRLNDTTYPWIVWLLLLNKWWFIEQEKKWIN